MKTDVILLPGLHGTAELWTPFISVAPGWARLFPVSLAPFGSQDYVELASRISPSLQEPRRCVIVAESFSGPLAIYLTPTLRREIALLVLSCTFVLPPFGSIGRLVPWQVIARMPLSTKGVEWFLTGGEKTLSRAIVKTVKRLPPQVVAARFRAISRVNAAKAFRQLSCPILLIRAKQDRVVSRSSHLFMGNLQPKAALAEVEGPHTLLQVKPEPVWEIIDSEFRSAA